MSSLLPELAFVYMMNRFYSSNGTSEPWILDPSFVTLDVHTYVDYIKHYINLCNN